MKRSLTTMVFSALVLASMLGGLPETHAGKVTERLEKRHQDGNIFPANHEFPKTDVYFCRGLGEGPSGRAMKFHSTELIVRPINELYYRVTVTPIYMKEGKVKLNEKKRFFDGIVERIESGEGYFLEGKSGKKFFRTQLGIRKGAGNTLLVKLVNEDASIYKDCSPSPVSSEILSKLVDSGSESESSSGDESDTETSDAKKEAKE
jgi:hypothetical protein